MSDHPILYSGPMIRALLEGRKTQTRRVVKPLTKRHPIQNLAIDGVSHGRNYSGKHDDPESWGFVAAEDGCDMALADWVGVLCPYGKPGDLLWVRETFQPLFADEWEEGRNPDGSGDRANYKTGEGYAPHYVADCGPTEFVTPDGDLVTRCTSPIHMPRWASRLTLRITDVRVERLQDISEADSIAEGVERTCTNDGWRHYCNDPEQEAAGLTPFSTALASFASLWRSINGPGSWNANPWVWAISFDVIKANIDHLSQRGLTS